MFQLVYRVCGVFSSVRIIVHVYDAKLYDFIFSLASIIRQQYQRYILRSLCGLLLIPVDNQTGVKTHETGIKHLIFFRIKVKRFMVKHLKYSQFYRLRLEVNNK